MKTYTNEWMSASGNAAYLTGLIIGVVKYSEMVGKERDKEYLLKQLIKIHSESPITNSEDLIKECKDLLNKLEVSV